jgi:hypothetical protein
MNKKQISRKKKKRKEIARKRVLYRRKKIREERKKEEDIKIQIESDYELKNGKIKPIVKNQILKNINVQKRIKDMKKRDQVPVVFIGEKINSSF